MAVGQLLIAGQDVTAYVSSDNSSIEFQANRLNGVAAIVLRDEGSTLGSIVRDRAEVVVKDGGTRIFGGHIATLTKDLDGGSTVWTVRAQSYDWLLDVRVIESGLRDGATRYDSDDVAWLASTFGSDFSLNGTTYVSQLRTQYLPTIDYSGMTIRQALSHLATYTTGAEYWVDEGIDAGTKYIHWTNPANAQLVSNGDLQSGTTNWTLGGDAAVTTDSGPSGTGDDCLTMTAAGVGTASQTVNAIIGNRRYMLWADLYASVISGARIRFDWQNVSSVSQRVDSYLNDTATTWVREKHIVTAPATATKVVITVDGQNAAADVRADNVSLVGEDAAWGISTTPNGTTTRRFWSWQQPSDSATPVNRVLVRGDGVSGWREHASSIAYYGQTYEAVLDDNRVNTTDGIDSRAAWLFSKYAFPSISGRYSTDQSGLKAGTWQIVEIEPFGIEAIEYVQTTRARFLGNGLMEYDVTYGAPDGDIAGVVVATGSLFGDQEPAIGVTDPVIPGADTTAPAVPTNLTVTSDTLSLAGEGVVRLVASLTQPGDADLQGSYVQLTRDESAPDTPDWTYAIAGFIPGTDNSVAFEGLAGNTDYYVRAWAEDVSGNRSAYVYPVTNPHTTVGDSNPPVMPDIVQVVPSFKALGVRWTSANAPDLRFYQVRWSDDGFATILGQENLYATTFVISPLDPGPEGAETVYSVQVRAVDLSGNVAPDWLVTGDASTDTFTLVDHAFVNGDTVQFDLLTGGTGLATETTYYVVGVATDTFQLSLTEGGGAIDFTSDVTSPSRLGYVTVPLGTAMPTAIAYNATGWATEAGWSAPGTGTAARAQGGDLATDSVLANNIFAGAVDAASMTGNQLVIKDTDDFARGIEVRNASDVVVGSWDATDGIVIADPTNTARRVTLESGAIRLWDGVAENAVTAITPDGIDAGKITFGESTGGHNLIPNSSFELSSNVGVADQETHTTWTSLPAGGAVTSNDSCTATTSITIASF